MYHLPIQQSQDISRLFSHDKLILHLVIFQVNHLLCKGSLCVVYLLQPLHREEGDKSKGLMLSKGSDIVELSPSTFNPITIIKIGCIEGS